MKKIFTLMATVLMAVSAGATTPYKCLHVEATATPTGAGSVYLAPKNDSEIEFLVDSSADMGETAFIKLVFGENGGGGDYKIGCNQGLGVYEVLLYTIPASGYELVCLADKVVESGVYGPNDCYPAIVGEGEGLRTISFDWTGEDIININTPNHGEDGNSDTEGAREALANAANFSDTPDVNVYAIFRKIGDDLPTFDPNKSDEMGISTVGTENASNVYYSITGQALAAPVKGINIVNGKKVILK